MTETYWVSLYKTHTTSKHQLWDTTPARPSVSARVKWITS